MFVQGPALPPVGVNCCHSSTEATPDPPASSAVNGTEIEGALTAPGNMSTLETGAVSSRIVVASATVGAASALPVESTATE